MEKIVTAIIATTIMKVTKHLVNLEEVTRIKEALKEKGIYIVDIEQLSAQARYEITGKKGNN